MRRAGSGYGTGFALHRSIENLAARYPAVWLSGLFIASRVVTFLFLAGRGTDLSVHSGYWRQVVAGGVPFRAFFPEYPPLAFLFTGILVLFDRSLEWYFPLFRAACCAVDCATWVAVLRMTKVRPVPCLLYLIGTTVLGQLLYDRIDIALGAVLLAAVACKTSGRDRLFHLAVGTGIAFKLIPVVWEPVALALEWKMGWRRFLMNAVLLSLPMIVSFDALAVLGGYQFDTLIDYHSRRGIQIESTPAAVQMIFLWLGAGGVVTFEFGSVNLHTQYETTLIHSATVLLVLALIAGGVMAARRDMTPTANHYLLAAVLAGALFSSKVLSPQHFVLLLPLLATLPASAGAPEAVGRWVFVPALHGLTGFLFPWHYDELAALEPSACALLMLRNGCLGVLGTYLFFNAWKSSSARALSLTLERQS